MVYMDGVYKGLMAQSLRLENVIVTRFLSVQS